MSKERNLLRVWFDGGLHPENYKELLRETKELLSQPEQEPVGWWDEKLGFFEEKHFDQLQPLYTSPQKREPLSDDVINDIFVNNQWKTFLQLARILEKAHGIGVDND